jgi:antitoxin (DNA-binding transcriptional repressor) of toxin-antitoxin stability system
MKTISFRELHTRTRHYVRRAATESITLTALGEGVARLLPVSHPKGLMFAQRRLWPGFRGFLATATFIRTDSTRMISEDRDH